MTDTIPAWKNRIVRLGTMPADEFLANPMNPRRHPQTQRDAVKGSLDTLGFISPVIVNKTTGFLLDGHERVMQALALGDNTPVPFIEVELSEDEEALALASFDWITQMAYYDRETLSGLLDTVNTDNEALQSLLSGLAMDAGIVPPDFNPMDEWQGMPEFEQEAIKSFHEIRIVFLKEDDMHAFARLLNQTVTDKTTSLFYPAKEKRVTGRYREGDDES